MRILRKSSWNDDRLDEFSHRTDEGFKEMRQGFDAIDRRFDAINQRFDRLTHTLMVIGGAAFVGFLGNGFFG
jgi:hypothetical protein